MQIKALKNFRIGYRLIIIFSLTTIFTMGMTILIINERISSLSKHDALTIAENVAGKYGNIVSAELQNGMTIAQTMAYLMEGTASDTTEIGWEYNKILNSLQVLLIKRNNLFGVYYGFEPELLPVSPDKYTLGHSDTGRFAPYAFKNDDNSITIRPLKFYNDDASDAWYNTPKETGTSTVTDIFTYEIGGKDVTLVDFVVPMYDNNDSFIGVAGCDITIEKLNDIFSTHKPYKKSGFITLFTHTGSIAAIGGNNNLLGENINKLNDVNNRFVESVMGNKNFSFIQYDEFLKDKYIIAGYHFPVYGTDSSWCVTVNIPTSVIFKQANLTVKICSMVGIAAIAIILIVTLLSTREISSQLQQGVYFTKEIAKGNLTATIDINQKDEIGQLAYALRDNMKHHLTETITDIRSAANQVSNGSHQLSSSAEQVSQGATEQASSIEEISASLEEMSTNISQNADNASETEKIALQASSDADESSAAVLQATDAMKQIAEKITIIDDIARQTGMLSLNASIEAARAGEHGKGFAVVASEVGKLAARSKDAAGEIGELSATTLNVAEQASEKLHNMVPNIKKTTELVQEISSSSREQSSGADQITAAVNQLESVTQQNASAAEEVSSVAEELSSQSDELQKTIAYFTVENGKRKLESKSTISRSKEEVTETAMAPLDNKSNQSDSNIELDESDFEHF